MRRMMYRIMERLAKKHKGLVIINGESIGHTSNFLLVKIPREYHQEDLVTVKVEKIEYPYCIAK